MLVWDTRVINGEYPLKTWMPFVDKLQARKRGMWYDSPHLQRVGWRNYLQSLD